SGARYWYAPLQSTCRDVGSAPVDLAALRADLRDPTWERGIARSPATGRPARRPVPVATSAEAPRTANPRTIRSPRIAIICHHLVLVSVLRSIWPLLTGFACSPMCLPLCLLAFADYSFRRVRGLNCGLSIPRNRRGGHP